jgi:hypothetical protein
MTRRRPIEVPEDQRHLAAYAVGATPGEWQEFKRTHVVTVSMHVKWWWRRTLRVLR